MGNLENAQAEQKPQTADAAHPPDITDIPQAAKIAQVNKRAILDEHGRFPPGVVQPGARLWKPGESGNPAGLSKAGRLTQLLIEYIEKDDRKAAKALIQVAIQQGLKGQFQFFQEIMNRLDGKVADRLADADGKPISQGNAPVTVEFVLTTPGKATIQMIEAAPAAPALPADDDARTDPDGDLAEKLARLRAPDEP